MSPCLLRSVMPPVPVDGTFVSAPYTQSPMFMLNIGLSIRAGGSDYLAVKTPLCQWRVRRMLYRFQSIDTREAAHIILACQSTDSIKRNRVGDHLLTYWNRWLISVSPRMSRHKPRGGLQRRLQRRKGQESSSVFEETGPPRSCGNSPGQLHGRRRPHRGRRERKSPISMLLSMK